VGVAPVKQEWWVVIIKKEYWLRKLKCFEEISLKCWSIRPV